MIGANPNELWNLPWIDLQVIQNGTDLWGFGPVNPVGYSNRGFGGYSLDIAVLTTKYIQYYQDYRFSPLSFAGSFFSVRPVIFPVAGDIVGYFAGLFPNFTNPFQLQYGIVRARFNISGDLPSNNFTQHWHFDPVADVAVVAPIAQLVTWNAYFKPMIHHMWNLSQAASPNTTFTVLIEPGTYWVSLILGDFNQSIPLTVSGYNWNPTHIGVYGGHISSSKIYWPYHSLILGISVDGVGTGAIVFVHTFNLTTRGVINLPANYSDPKALIVDEFNHTLYVAMNGGGAILRIDIPSMAITGYQNVPPYLTRAWSGQDTPDHLYFITNEQHTKVFRLSKLDFCTKQCPMFGYCERGSCQCSTGFQMKDGSCQWAEMVVEKHSAEKDKAGEAVLGVFFALSFVAASVGWYLVWKSKRGSYSAV